MTETVLVTGANGFAGRCLNAIKYDLYLCSRDMDSYVPTRNEVKKFFSSI